MNEKEKDLLIKDLCARLPYGIKASYYGADEECETWDEVDGIAFGYVEIGQYSLPIERVKPYLFPMSSMTEEQAKEYNNLNCYEVGCFPHTEEALDYLIKNHFDYRGLIPMGLAIDATNLNIY